MENKITGFLCFALVSITFAAVIHDGINYAINDKNSPSGKEIRLLRSLQEHRPPLYGSLKD